MKEASGIITPVLSEENIDYLKITRDCWRETAKIMEKDRDYWKKTAEIRGKSLLKVKEEYDDMKRDREFWKGQFEDLNKPVCFIAKKSQWREVSK